MRLPKTNLPLPQLLTLLASSVLCMGLIESGFRAFQSLSPELNVDLIAADQHVSRELARKRNAARMERMMLDAFSDLDLSGKPELFESESTRVLFLGDSFTQGFRLESPQDRFSNVLQRRINDDWERSGFPQRLHIFNAGIGGTNPTWWTTYFHRIGPVYKPHILFVIFFLRDGAPIPTSVVENRAEIEPIRLKYRNMPAYEHSATLRFLYNKLAWSEYSEEYKRKMTSAYVGTREERATWVQRRGHLRRIAKECELNGVQFHLVIFPMLLDLDDYPFFEVEDEIRRFARTNGIPVFSLTPGFLGEHDRSLWASPTNQHPNTKAHRIAADTLDPYLRHAIATHREKELRSRNVR